MEKLYVLVGKEAGTDEIKLLASWYKMPSQAVVDKITTSLKANYESFALLQDILFIAGEAKVETRNWMSLPY